MILASWGSAWGTWRAGLGVCHMGIDHPKGIIKNIVPIVMAGVLGIYGLIVSVIITQSISPPGGEGYNTYSVYNGYTHVSAISIVLTVSLPSVFMEFLAQTFSPSSLIDVLPFPSYFLFPEHKCLILLS